MDTIEWTVLTYETSSGGKPVDTTKRIRDSTCQNDGVDNIIAPML